MTSDPAPEHTLPFAFWWPIVVGALAGVALRLVYSGAADAAYTAMSTGFVMLAPIVVGAVTVFLGERLRRRTLGYHVVASIFATVLFVVGTLVILIEGLICAVIILPLFAALGVLGGILMLLGLRFTSWAKQMLGCIVLLPLVLGDVDSDLPLRDDMLSIERTVLVQAPSAAVWLQIMNARDIRSEEIGGAWLFRIGVPLPVDGVLDAAQSTRRVRMGKNVYFDELIVESSPNERVRWTYRFYADSFPRYALDEHVLVGGRYFDVRDTSYELTPRGDATELRMRIGVRVSTRFNWYASPAARFLLGNLMESNLGYYRRRSEADGG
jgi:hypothetical protein